MYRHKNLAGIGLASLAAAIGAADAALVKYLSSEVHPFLMGFTRSAFGLAFMLPWIMTKRQVLHTPFLRQHVVRAGIKLASLLAFYLAFAIAPLAEVSAIAFAAPVFVTVAAWLFLSEKMRVQRVVSMAIGFLGVIVILVPHFGSEISPGLSFALLGAILTACIHLMLKPMSGREQTSTIVAWNLIATVPLSMLPAFYFWELPRPGVLALLALQGFLGVAAMAAMTRAMSLADLSLVITTDFIRLPLAALLGYVLFAEVLAPTTWIGVAAIFVATVLLTSGARKDNGT